MPCQAHANADLATPLAARLAVREMSAVAAFANCYAELLSVAFSEMRRTVDEHCLDEFEGRQSQDGQVPRKRRTLTKEDSKRLQAEEERRRQHVLRCSEPLGDLYPHVAIRAGIGCLKRHAARVEEPRCLQCHTDGLLLADLFLAAACLNQDEAANKYFLDLVEQRIKPSALKKYRSRLGESTVLDTVYDLFSQCWTAAKSRVQPVASPAEENRLSHFNGTASLNSWLYGMIEHALLDAIRKKKPEPWPAGADDGSPEPEPPDDRAIPEAIRLLKLAVEKYFDPLQTVFDRRLADLQRDGKAKGRGMTRYYVAVLWLKCGARPSDIADALGIARAAVSQHLTSIRQYMVAQDEKVFEEISQETGCPLSVVKNILASGVEYFMQSELTILLCEQFSELRRQSAPVFQVGVCILRKGYEDWEIAQRTARELDEVRRLRREFGQWVDKVVAELARRLNAKYEVPEEILAAVILAAIQRGMAEGQKP